MRSFSRFASKNKGSLQNVNFFASPGVDDSRHPTYDPLTMRKYKDPPQVSRKDNRTGDEFIRQWCEHIGSVVKASKQAGLYRNHLHVWLTDPSRNLNPENARKLAHAANMPVEAVLYRWTRIKDLDLWKWTRIRR
jgi:hypothetical protein